jgi:hypothetical protein
VARLWTSIVDSARVLAAAAIVYLDFVAVGTVSLQLVAAPRLLFVYRFGSLFFTKFFVPDAKFCSFLDKAAASDV